MTDPARHTTFRPSFSRTIAGVVIGTCALAAVSLLADDTQALLVWGPWLALVAGVAWALFWQPRVDVSDGGVTVVNVFRTIEVPWPTIEDVQTKWALTLDTAFGTVKAWAAPAPGRQVMRRAQAEDRRVGGHRAGTAVRPSDLPSTESGAAALIVRQRWLRLRDAGHLDAPVVELDHLRTRWHHGVIAGAVVVGALCAWTLFT